MQTPVENPLMTIDRFNRQFQIGEKESEGETYLEGGRVKRGMSDTAPAS